MTNFTREDLTTLLAPHREPCVTICLPTHRRLPESQQDPIRYRNLVKEAVGKLEERHGRRADGVAEMIARLESLGASTDGGGFWSRQRDGLAVFASPDHFSWHSVPQALREITVVADSFHVKPLLPLLFDDARYHVLCVSRDSVRLFEGGRDDLEEVELDGVPRNLTDALGEEWNDSRQALAFHGKRGGGEAGQHFHGGAGSERTQEIELERFLRAVDQGVLQRVSKKEGLPLILCALDEYHSVFRAVSKNPNLVERGIARAPARLSSDELRQAAWETFEPVREARLVAALDEVGTGTNRGQGSTDLSDIARATVQGRVKTLLLQERHRIWGRLDRTSGAIKVDGEQGQAGSVDLLDEMAEMTIARGGDVLLVPAERMPTRGGIAAAYRY